MIRIQNTGCGVQSTAIQLMSLHGELPKPDAYIFADTGDEPADVYEWAGIRWLTVKRNGPTISEHMRERIGGGRRLDKIPAFAASESTPSPIVRDCTREWKIKPIEAAVKIQLLGLSKAARWPTSLRVETWLGISGDEMQRMKCSVVPWQRFWHPLIEHPWVDGPVEYASLRHRVITRDDCLAWIKEHGYPEPPRSACVYCPFHSNHEWRRIRAMPAEWERAVEIDRLLRSGEGGVIHGMRTPVYLHRSLVPLDQAPIDGIAGQTSFLEECAGVCGV